MLKRVLVAPLNWGLGHAARCIPMVRSLLAAGVEPVLASDGESLALLRAEFPDLPAFALPGYGIRYSSANMVWNVGKRLPRLVWAIGTEQRVVERLVRDLRIDGVLSDNRYGCFSRQCPSALITHQLHPRIPGRASAWAGSWMLREALSRFDSVWVPDAPGEPNLSGALSHGAKVHPNTQFIGIISRMEVHAMEEEYDVVIVLSGPEPQRTWLEERLLEQALALPHHTIIVQGKTQKQQHYFVAEHVEVVSYLTSARLNDVLLAGRCVVCRAGYSSIMDLAVLGKKALLIPTPGQTEQEYLAEWLGGKGYVAHQIQSRLDLGAGLAALNNTSGIPSKGLDQRAYEPILHHWLGK
jgi:UDP:flavonoid glycosyltransferase YjiC (YdhE family)